jgi:hypothetical protein
MIHIKLTARSAYGYVTIVTEFTFQRTYRRLSGNRSFDTAAKLNKNINPFARLAFQLFLQMVVLVRNALPVI